MISGVRWKKVSLSRVVPFEELERKFNILFVDVLYLQNRNRKHFWPFPYTQMALNYYLMRKQNPEI